MNKRPHHLVVDLTHLGRGVLMGATDIIPGVSGGTIALIVGIYVRLVTAVSHFDFTFIDHLGCRRWKAAIEHIDLRFLMALGLGILIGIVTFASLINHLLTTTTTRSFTLAAFFGAIAASCWLVTKWIQPKSTAKNVTCWMFAVVAAVLAFLLTSIPTTSVDPSLGYIFFCGLLAICAMILPGISGAFILLVLGVYVYLTDYIKGLPRGEISSDAIVTVAVFGAGCAIGLLSFSKILRWMLVHYQSETMSVMCGFMIGALNKIWPFQTDLTPSIIELKHKQYENFLPRAIDGQVISCIAIALMAMGIVLTLDRMSRGWKKSDSYQTAKS